MRSLILLIGLAASAFTGQGQGRDPALVAVYGDSFSAGGGDDLEDPGLWPNMLERMLDSSGKDWEVSNRSINGNGLVWRTRCFGEPATERLTSDLDLLPMRSTLILMAGVNDVIQPNLPAGFSTCFEPADVPATSVVEKLQSVRSKMRERRLLVATLPPFGGSEFHTERAELTRQEVNRWLRAHWPKKDLIELDRILADSADPEHLRSDFDSGDGLHPNSAGAEAIATAVSRQVR